MVDWVYEGGGLGLLFIERVVIVVVGGIVVEGVVVGVGREEGLV